MDLADLPALNASLNASAAVLLLLGFRFAKRREVARHRACMLAATAVSALFLVSYVVYHVGKEGVVTRFPGTGAARIAYMAILGTHTPLAAALLPLLFTALRRAFRGDVEGHRRVVRWAYPVWLYVSVTGVVIYVMLYRVTWA